MNEDRDQSEPGAEAPIISSAKHKLAVQIRKIARRPQIARRSGLFLIDGIHLHEEILRTSYQPEAILFSPGLSDKPPGQKLLHSLRTKRWPLYQVTTQLMEQLSPVEAPQGILSLFHRQSATDYAAGAKSVLPDHNLPADHPNSQPFYLLCAGLQDPGNLGSLARTAAAFGCRGLVMTENTIDPLHTKTIRASSGSILHLPLFPDSTDEAIARWRQQGNIVLVAFTAHGGQAIRNLPDFLATGRSELSGRSVCLVLGAEGGGIPKAIDDLCDAQWRLPLTTATESLGVAAAGTLGLYLISQLLSKQNQGE